MNTRKIVWFSIFLLLSSVIFAENLVLDGDELFIEESIKGGYDLWVKAESGIGSVLLTESTADPEMQASSFALRSPVYNEVNGDEKRMLNGEFLVSQGKTQFALIDSTPENHPEYGPSYHIFVPYIVIYGYSWSREGELQMLDGSWFNIRTFRKPYADYSGGYHDNPFVIRVIQKPLPEPEFMEEAVEAFEEIAKETVRDEGDLVGNIRGLIRQEKGETLDLVLCLDTTKSMEDDVPFLQQFLIPMLKEETAGFKSFRFGMVLYRDYYEEYVTKSFPFQHDLSLAQNYLNSIRVFGGRDIPEAVNEALYEGIHAFDWSAENRKIILIGDAPPHPRPRGKVTAEMVAEDSESLGIEIDSIILPQ